MENITPQQIVERWYPNYQEELSKFTREYHLYHGYGYSHAIKVEDFTKKHFAEALAERDRQRDETVWKRACTKCSEIAQKLHCGNLLTETLKYTAMPKMEE